jgi:serine phosphatase RsbU (regulator of sigma subunit)
VAASHPARAGVTISVKLVFATSIVVASAVGISAWFSLTSMQDITDKQIAARRQNGEHSIVRESELVAQMIASSIAQPLANNTYADVIALVDAAISNAETEGDKRVQWLVVTDQTGTRVHATPGAPQDDKLAAYDRLLVDGVKRGAVVHARIAGTEWVYEAPVMAGANKVGRLRMGVTTAALERELGDAIAAATERAKRTRNRMLMVSIAVLAIGLVLAALYGIRLARPIKALTVQADRISRGKLDSRVPATRGDELGVLAHAFNKMADEIRDLLVEQAQKASLEKEMSLARQVQQAMLPPDTLDQHGHLKVVGYCMPASSCGGDWWTYRKLASGRMLLVVGDATGHGIHSAMIAATARGAVEALSGIDERLLTPEQVLRAIDSAIRQVGDHNVLMTAFAAVFDSANGVLHYANAGQNFPYVIKLGATRVLEDASIIAASGNPLGDRNIAVEIRRGSLQLRPGDLFVCFTDGLVERVNRAGKLFGDRRLRGVITGQALPDGHALLRLRDQIVRSLDQYAEGVIAEDDITFVLCQFDPPASRREVGRGAA